MTDKKAFGAYIKQKRMERGLSQRDMAEQLYVSEGAVSKWERGVSYPDITLISEICRVLEVSEHELITASTDTEARRVRQDAHRFRVIRGVWFWTPTIAYGVALLTCFICNLAVSGTWSWFFIVAAALVCAYTFVPTLTGFFPSGKLLSFCVSTYLSISLLLFTCAVYTDGLRWWLTACLGTLIGYAVVFLPILLSKTAVSRFKFLIAFSAAWLLTVLLLCQIHSWHPLMLLPAIGMACYGYLPALFSALVCTLRWDGFLKAGVCTVVGAVLLYFTEAVVDVLFGLNDSTYAVDFHDWAACLEGNIYCLFLVFFLLLSAVFFVIGICRKKK